MIRIRRVDKLHEIKFAYLQTPVGQDLLATADHKICYLGFGRDNFQELYDAWLGSNFIQDQSLEKLVDKIFSENDFELLVCATDFQLQVWNALLKIPRGELA